MQNDRRRAWSEHPRAHLHFLTEWLEGLTPASTWCIVALSAACILAADFIFNETGVRFGPLYMLPVCLVSWRFGLGIGLTVAIAASVLTVFACVAIAGHMSVGATGNLTMHMLMLTTFAVIVASLRNGFDWERLLAGRDGITGALNRPAFAQQARTMMALATAQRVPLLLAYIDLDGFKLVNDEYGHEAGDRILQQFAQEGRATLRQMDCFGRMGGDEFAVMMVLPSSTTAQQAAKRLHAGFAAALATTGHAVTSSMGVVIVEPDRGATLDELMREADQLMYAVKRSDKNGFRLAVSAPALEPDLVLFAERGGQGVSGGVLGAPTA
jgi:diguanylate cyclase (GGDEF)-like protein